MCDAKIWPKWINNPDSIKRPTLWRALAAGWCPLACGCMLGLSEVVIVETEGGILLYIWMVEVICHYRATQFKLRIPQLLRLMCLIPNSRTGLVNLRCLTPPYLVLFQDLAPSLPLVRAPEHSQISRLRTGDPTTNRKVGRKVWLTREYSTLFEVPFIGP